MGSRKGQLSISRIAVSNTPTAESGHATAGLFELHCLSGNQAQVLIIPFKFSLSFFLKM